jgi:hypothetical protein
MMGIGTGIADRLVARVWLCGAVAVLCVNPAPAQDASPDAAQLEFFEKKVRPVLAQKCYACHNSKQVTAMGGLRVDTKEGLLRGGDSGAAVVPGDAERSLLLKAIGYSHDLKMPPTGKLADEQIADLTTWVEMGAPDPRAGGAPPVVTKGGIDFRKAREFWAFQPVQRTGTPEVMKKDWVRTPVDAFILARLEKEALTPAAEADKRTLLRRVTYDLTGLPPTREEMRAFLQDNTPRAYEKAVERLLASPHYGERWARHWLDLVRYAETNGHEYDNDKSFPWQYRDYLIRAFQQDIPYNQFVREHISGDLLEQKRLRADGGAWESPIATGFYWFNEVLNSATDSEKSRADDVDNQIDVAGKAFLGLTVACARCHDHKFDPIPAADYYGLAGVFHSTDLREAVIDSPARAAAIEAASKRIREINREIEELTGKGAETILAETREPEYREGDKVFERFAAKDFGKWVRQGIAFGEGPLRGKADSRSAGSDVFSGTLTSPKFRTGKSLYLHVRIGGTKGDGKLKERGPLRFTIVADGYKGQHIVPDGEGDLRWKTLTLTFERERTCYFEIIDRSREGHIIVDEIVFSDSKEPPRSPEVAAKQEEPRRELQVETSEKVKRLVQKRQRWESQVPDSEYAMVAEDRDCADVKLHIRGNHKNLGEIVPRRFLQVIAGEQQALVKAGSGRLEIAEWTASERNPLTARVMVNRIWKHHFGQGLVRSVDNFGKTGDAPTHPELLDYLASEFTNNGWSIKNLHRMMVLSNTYRMSSEPSAEAKQVDPTNKYLSRMTVWRLEGEAVRDGMLQVAGVLNRQLYGPSVPPHISAHQDGRGKPESGPLDGNGRRSIYIQVRRNFMTPMFLAFDYPVPISTIGARTVSTVPSQALLMMNNEFVAQQAERWAVKTLVRVPEDEGRVMRMFEEAYGREAEALEISRILEYARAQQEQGRAERDVWADVAHVLFNSAEFIYVR